MANIPKLKGRLVESGVTVRNLAEMSGVSASQMYRKLKNHGEHMSLDDVNKIIAALKLRPDDAIEIFLPQVSHEMRKQEGDNE